MINKIIILAIMMLPLAVMSQENIFEKYDNSSDVTYISINPEMFQMIARMGIDQDDAQVKAYMDMVKSITSFKTLVTEKAEISLYIKNWVTSSSNTLDELMVVKNDGDLVRFYVKEGADSTHIKELLIFISADDKVLSGQDDATRNIGTKVIYLTGDLNLNEISKLMSKMNIPGGEHLNK